MGIKILTYGCDVGGANALGEVIEGFLANHSPRKARLRIFSKGLGYKIWKEKSFPVKKLPKKSEIEKAIEWADVVFTATSCPAGTEPLLWRAAKDLGKPAIALLDFWTHYVERFTDPANGKIVWPDKILVMDELAKKELINCGAPAENIEITGQPFLARRIKDFSGGRISKRTELKGLNIMFVSQPLHKMPNKKKWGYDEFKVLDCIIEALNPLAGFSSGLRPNLIIRAHPRESYRDLKSHLDLSDIKFKWGFDKENNPDKTIAKCQFIFGMSSMLLIEAALANKTVVSIQPGLVSEDPFPLSRFGYCKRIGKPDILREYVVEKIAGRDREPVKASKEFVRGNLNSRERIVKILLSFEKIDSTKQPGLS